MRETLVWSLSWEDPLEKWMAAPLQDSCLENPTDGGAWRATVHWVTKSRTRLSDFAQKVGHTFWERSDFRQSFSFMDHTTCHNYPTLLLQHKSSCIHLKKKKLFWLRSNKTWFTKAKDRLVFALQDVVCKLTPLKIKLGPHRRRNYKWIH